MLAVWIRVAFRETIRFTPRCALLRKIVLLADGLGRLDVVLNNAGYGDVAPFEQLSSERFKAAVDTNFYGVERRPIDLVLRATTA